LAVQRITAKGEGFELVLFENEIALLRDLAQQLQEVVGGGVPDDRGTDAVRERLFPRAYLDPTEDVAEETWQSSVHEDLVRAKAANLSELTTALDDVKIKRDRAKLTLSKEQLDEWISALNDVRLALGVALGVSEEQEIEPDADNAAAFEIYYWLTHLQGNLIDALVGGAEF
jgi:SHS2 domain-containing protein